ncbi:transposase [Cardiobacterium valvarum]
MPNSSGFSDILKQHLSWHKARIDCLASIITALFVRQTVNLSALKKRLFLKGQAGVHLSPYAAFLCRGPYRQNRCSLLRLPGFRLAKPPPHPRAHNMGIRQILYQHPGAGCSLAWCRYPGSNTGERMLLLELFRETFPEVHIETLYADRKFFGNEWLAYLRQAGISYCTRCKENAQIAGR